MKNVILLALLALLIGACGAPEDGPNGAAAPPAGPALIMFYTEG